jgi:hypothetical protein
MIFLAQEHLLTDSRRASIGSSFSALAIGLPQMPRFTDWPLRSPSALTRDTEEHIIHYSLKSGVPAVVEGKSSAPEIGLEPINFLFL